MFRRDARSRDILAFVVLACLLTAEDLSAQDPGAPRPTPLPIPTTRPLPDPRPIPEDLEKVPARIDPEALRRPDLELTLRPQSMGTAPRAFTVKNTGSAEAARASLLRVTIRLLPLEAGAGLALPSGGEESDPPVGLRLSPENVFPRRRIGDGLSQSEFEEICVPPFEDFEAAIDPLDPGESQVISQSGIVRSGGVMEVGLVAARPGTRIPNQSYIRQIEVRLVCVYEVRATADANREVQELLERNNEIVHIFQREVRLR